MIRILDTRIARVDLKTRMPFRYGIATMTATPHLFMTVVADVNGVEVQGVSADHLPPKWFTKDPAKAVEAEILEMEEVIGHASAIARGMQGKSAFDLWRNLWEEQGAWGRARRFPPLLTHFGTSLVERALIEAVCKALSLPFCKALITGALGLDLGRVHSELAGFVPATFLPGAPEASVLARHTVGLADPLDDAEIEPKDRLEDGLPQSLEACVRAYGLRHFKIKVQGDLSADLARLARIEKVLDRAAAQEWEFSLDGNEQFKSFEQFQMFWSELNQAQPALLRRLLFVEQPFHRDCALDAGQLGKLRQWNERPLLIIDESDAELGSLGEALALGYHGTSHKNCKGVFKGAAHACWLRKLEIEQPGRRFVMSGEDLANIGPVALLQDLAAAAAFGIRTVERNGHHYFAGLSAFPPAVWEQMLRRHPCLYHQTERGWPSLTIWQGSIAVRSVNAAPFGVGFDLDLGACGTSGQSDRLDSQP